MNTLRDLEIREELSLALNRNLIAAMIHDDRFRRVDTVGVAARVIPNDYGLKETHRFINLCSFK